jgi:O-antigen/teichoic acid export membrane protein
LFGKGFEGGAMVLLILGTGHLANAATGPTGVLLTMTGKQKWELANTVSLVIFNLILNLLLVPKFGTIGAAIATGISIATINLLKLIQVRAFFGLRAYNVKFLKGLTAIGCAGVVAWCVRIWVHSFSSSPYTIMPLGGIGFLITAIFAFWLLGLDHEDKIAIAALRRRRGPLEEIG